MTINQSQADGGFMQDSLRGLYGPWTRNLVIFRIFFRMIVLAIVTCMFGMTAIAQFRTSIQGVVTDPQGDVVPGATLTLTNLSTNETIVRTSNGSGVFNFNALPADHFSLVIESKGFKKKVLTDLQLIPEQPNALNVQLELGEATETITVDASQVPALDTQTASVGGTISSNQIQHLPSFGRDVFQLAQLAPGVFGNGSQSAGGGTNNLPGTQGPGGTAAGAGIFQTENGPQALANGGQYNTNSISIDGISTVPTKILLITSKLFPTDTTLRTAVSAVHRFRSLQKAVPTIFMAASSSGRTVPV
jgi:Carboxypeptidase regulatory-like domain